MRVRVGLWLSIFLFTAGCADCGYEPPSSSTGDAAPSDGMVDDGGDETPDDGTSGEDASPMLDGTMGDDAAEPFDASDASDAQSRCPDNEQVCGGACVDTSTNAEHCGACGESCGEGATCRDGACRCPQYQRQCDGECIPTHGDPANCGGCGNTCSGEQVCASGECADECLPGRRACDGRCVDTSTDSDHCGACGNECAFDEGCVDGECETAIAIGDPPEKCSGGGPQIDVEISAGDDERCTGNVAEEVFRWGMCSCDDLVFDDGLVTDAFDSTLGRYRPGGPGAGVGTNGSLDAGSDVEIRGALWASGEPGASFDDGVDIHQQLHVGGNLDIGTTGEFRKDAWIEGNIEADDSATFRQHLTVRSDSEISSGVSYAGLTERNVQVGEACGECSEADRLPISEIVSRHSGPDNDNAAVGLDPEALAGSDGDGILRLPCGEYYLSSIDVNDSTTIVAEGRTALYVGGDVEIGQNLTIKPTAGAELDVFIAGDVTLDDRIELGDAAYPASTRFYVGGDDGWDFGSDGRMAGFVYALPGGIVADDGIELYGGMYTDNLDAGSDVEIHYDRGILQAGESCVPPAEPDPEPVGDAGLADADGRGGMDADGSGGDADGRGGSGETCGGAGASCGEDGDCCVPLVCGAEGTCDVKACRALGESCEENVDCCSGTCAEAGGQGECISS